MATQIQMGWLGDLHITPQKHNCTKVQDFCFHRIVVSELCWYLWSFPTFIPLGKATFSELLLKFKPLKMPVRALLRLAPLMLGNAQAMVLWNEYSEIDPIKWPNASYQDSIWKKHEWNQLYFQVQTCIIMHFFHSLCKDDKERYIYCWMVNISVHTDRCTFL